MIPGFAIIRLYRVRRLWVGAKRFGDFVVYDDRWASDDESDITLSTTLVNEERGRRQETEVHVSQQQAETMMMDFLATFADVKGVHTNCRSST